MRSGRPLGRGAGLAGRSGLTALGLALLCALPAGTAAAQDTGATLDWDTLEDEGGWLLSVRPALGVDPKEGLFPELGGSFGYQFPDHVYLGLHVAGRFTPRYHVRLGPRLGVFFGRSGVAFGLGASPGLLIRTEPLDIGACITWGSDLRVRLARHDFLLVFAEFDLLFEALGFSETTWLFGTGIGWVHSF